MTVSLTALSPCAPQSLVPVLNKGVMQGLCWMPTFLALGQEEVFNVSLTSTALELPTKFYRHTFDHPSVLLVEGTVRQLEGLNNFFAAARFDYFFDRGDPQVYGESSNLVPTRARSILDKILVGESFEMVFSPSGGPPSDSSGWHQSLTIGALLSPTLIPGVTPNNTTPSTPWTGVVSPEFLHHQAARSEEWTITHTLGTKPIVSVYTEGGVNLTGLAKAAFPDDSTVLIQLPEALSGFAVLTTNS